MATDLKFNDFQVWKQTCDLVGLNGPVGIQGKGKQYLAADGSQAAIWDGNTDTGEIFVDVPDNLVNVITPDDSGDGT